MNLDRMFLSVIPRGNAEGVAKRAFEKAFTTYAAAWEKKVRGNIVPVKDLFYSSVVETVLKGY